MKFYSRNDILYVRLNSKRVSTKLKDTKANRKLVMSYYKNDEFFKKFDVNKNVPTVVELCEEVLREKEKTLKPTSYCSYISLFNSRIVPYFKKKLITEIKPSTIKAWYKTFDDKSTLSICTSIMNDTFELAILDEYVSSSPLFAVKFPKMESAYKSNPFTLDEVKQILSLDSFIRNFLGIAFFTGMRAGEIIGLKWKDLNFEKRTISIERTRTKGFEHSPKTKSSKAVIDLPSEALPFFQEQRKKTGLMQYCFNSVKNKPFSDSGQVNPYFHKILKELSIPKRGIHQTRHTFASLKLSLGERLEWVSFMLRHKSPRITLDVYYKYLPKADETRVLIDIGDAQNRHTS